MKDEVMDCMEEEIEQALHQQSATQKNTDAINDVGYMIEHMMPSGVGRRETGNKLREIVFSSFVIEDEDNIQEIDDGDEEVLTLEQKEHFKKRKHKQVMSLIKTRE